MKVRELIRRLKKMPQNAVVVARAHYNTLDEIQGYIDEVSEPESEELLERLGPYVVLCH
jgi:hypothetical protein